jgi:predicted secreted hydrolase
MMSANSLAAMRCVLSLALLTGCQGDIAQTPQPPLALGDALQADNAEFSRATTPRDLQFPADHGPHEDFATEWWYFTGNLASDSGRRFGYQLTFFRIGLHAKPVARESHWAAHELYMAHFAITDAEANVFHRFERVARAVPELAGAQAQPLRVWLEDWSVQSLSSSESLPLRLQAQHNGVAVDLQLRSTKPLVLQGDHGLSQKSAEKGNASYYYSFTRMPTAGSLSINGQTIAVTGDSWFDREWSTSALAPEQAGWDWFSLQFDNNSELMFYRLRRKDGSMDEHSRGSLVDAQGDVTTLRAQDIVLAPQGYWRSPNSSVRYPVQWQLELPQQQLSLRVTPLIEQQEMDLSVRYWEGAVTITGQKQGQPISGRGYLELAGYP